MSRQTGSYRVDSLGSEPYPPDMLVTPLSTHADRLGAEMMELFRLDLLAVMGDRAPLELDNSIRSAPDDDTRLLVALWAAECGHDLLDQAIARPAPVFRLSAGPVFDDAWRQGRSMTGLDDESEVPVQAWLFHREVAERMRDKLLGRVIEYDNAGIMLTQRLLRETMTECGADEHNNVRLNGIIRDVKINITINTGDSA
jgi:hypothetical protein